MNNPILGCWWVVNAESLENKGIPRFSFRFESLSPRQKYGNDSGYSHIFLFMGIERDSRVGAVLREQNALPYGGWITVKLTAKDDVDNVGAGRAAKGENPSACATALEF